MAREKSRAPPSGGERFGVAQTLGRLAALAAAAQPERALTLAGAADAVYEDLGARRTPAERQKLERWLLPLRETLNTEDANAAWARGRDRLFSAQKHPCMQMRQ